MLTLAVPDSAGLPDAARAAGARPSRSGVGRDLVLAWAREVLGANISSGHLCPEHGFFSAARHGLTGSEGHGQPVLLEAGGTPLPNTSLSVSRTWLAPTHPLQRRLQPGEYLLGCAALLGVRAASGTESAQEQSWGVGIDLESGEDSAQGRALLEKSVQQFLFSPQEQERIRRSQTPASAALRSWAGKEARLKALGQDVGSIVPSAVPAL